MNDSKARLAEITTDFPSYKAICSAAAGVPGGVDYKTVHRIVRYELKAARASPWATGLGPP